MWGEQKLRNRRGIFKKYWGPEEKGRTPVVREKFTDITLIDNLIVDCLIGHNKFIRRKLQKDKQRILYTVLLKIRVQYKKHRSF